MNKEDGSVQWIKQTASMNSSDDDDSPSISADSTGVYVSYQTNGTVSGGQNSGAFDIVVMRMNKEDGSVQWIKQTASMNTAGRDVEPSISADSTGVYVAYETFGTVSGGQNSGGSDIVVMRMNKEDGSVQWIKQTQTMNTSEYDISPSISADSTGVYVSYQTYGIAPGQDNVNSGSYDIAVMRLVAPVPCLLEGTLVRTPTGSTPIELIKEGDYVLNQHYNPVRVTLTTSRTLQYNANPTTKYDLNNVIYTLPSGTLGATSNVYLSKHHKFMTSDGTMKKPEEYGLKRSELSDICKTGELYTVYHLRLEDEYNNHFIVNGDCVVEDWYDWPRPITRPELLD